MMNLSEAANVINAKVVGKDARFLRVTTDSRNVQQGDLFVALVGEKFDGHHFVASALAQGAIGAMVQHEVSEVKQASLLQVKNTRRALGEMAGSWRRKFSIPVIAVAGSNGKTTVKEMIASILREQVSSFQFLVSSSEISAPGAQLETRNQKPETRILATEGNLNNDIGVPLTLLRLREQHRAAVVEIGMNHPGEIAYLAQQVQPTIALVTNCQREHMEFMHTLEEVAKENACVFHSLVEEGIAIINADDAFADFWREQVRGKKVIDFGLSNRAMVSAIYKSTQLSSEIEFSTPVGKIQATLHIAGEHNVRNAAAATASAVAVGMDLAAIKQGLENFQPVKGRLQIKEGKDGSIVIDDTYNANPDSVTAAINVLATLPHKKILILGDMGEVGEQGVQFHEEIGRHAKQKGIDVLLSIGELTRHAVKAFGKGAAHYSDIRDLLQAAQAHAKVAFLVKGSRFMKMERVVENLVKEKKASF